MTRVAPLGLLVALWVAAIGVRAWVCDDAAITFRVVDHWLDDFGPRWNVVEHVQVFSHPLWMLLLAAVTRVTAHPYWTSLGLGILLSAATALVVAFRMASSVRAGAVALVLLLASVASLDYATAGMENALGHLLVAWALFAFVYYGSWIPNSARAKLATGFPVAERCRRVACIWSNHCATIR